MYQVNGILDTFQIQAIKDIGLFKDILDNDAYNYAKVQVLLRDSHHNIKAIRDKMFSFISVRENFFKETTGFKVLDDYKINYLVNNLDCNLIYNQAILG